MCGICGVVGEAPLSPVDKGYLIRMRDTMVHRGPDDKGVFIANNVGLGHRRLSIIDLTGGHQPMSNPQKTLWVTYNGEIYNFREIKTVLESKGYVFRTKSDTEVILYAYAEYGESCVDHFRGMFAFGLWDHNRRQLLLARDGLGIKPLYYCLVNGTLLFASEIKALLQWPGIVREVDSQALRDYLRFRYVPGPRTMFQGIWKLPSGHILTFRDGKASVRQYWDLDRDARTPGAVSEEEFLEGLRESVRLRLISDVPLGGFLSGGLDSSTVVALMSSMAQEPIQTFTVGYPDGGPGSEVTEFAYARMVADRFDATHREFELDSSKFWEALPRLVWHFDEPVADPAAIPLYFLSKYAREFVTVALSGEGADELLAGYSIYKRMLFLQSLRKIPGIAPLARLAQPTAGRKLSRYLHGLSGPLSDRYSGVSALFSEAEIKNLLIPALRGHSNGNDGEQRYLIGTDKLDPLSRMLYYDLRVWLPDELLVKADKMTMAASLELRVPFLDHKFVEMAWRLPSRFKLQRGTGKHLLREAVSKLLPAPILNRKKLGFPVPIQSWFRDDLKQRAWDLLADPDCAYLDYFEYGAIKSLLDRHVRGDDDLSVEIYALVNFNLWHRQFIESNPIAARPAAVGRLEVSSA